MNKTVKFLDELIFIKNTMHFEISFQRHQIKKYFWINF